MKINDTITEVNPPVTFEEREFQVRLTGRQLCAIYAFCAHNSLLSQRTLFDDDEISRANDPLGSLYDALGDVKGLEDAARSASVVLEDLNRYIISRSDA